MKISLKIFANPYYLFAIVWAVCLMFYSLRWANIYPELSVGLQVFTIIAIIICVPFGAVFQIVRTKNAKSFEGILNVERILIFNSFLWLLNFLYSGIPLLNSLLGRNFDHTDSYGIPSLIVFDSSFTGFLSLVLFYHYLRTKNKKYLFYYAFNMMFFVLIFSRGNIMTTILSTFFLWLFMERKKISLKAVAAIACSFLLLLYLFGVAGNYRTISEMKKYASYTDDTYNSNLILEIADQSESFKNSVIPDEFMWGYLYLTSPIGNLQENIDQHKVEITAGNAIAFFVNEFSWDFVSKRVIKVFGIKEVELNLFIPQLAVSTTFARPYLYLGWIGIIIYMVAMLILPLGYFFVMRSFPLWPLGMAVLCSIYFFSIFDNMFTLSGLSLQLVYPLFFMKLKKEQISV